MEKKLVSTSQKISCPLARINSFFENCLFLIMFSTSSKIALTKKKILSSLGRKSFSNSWIKDTEKCIATIQKSCCYLKKFLKKLVSNGSSLKIDFPLISIIVSASRKDLRIKQYCFQQTKNLISLAGMKYWLKKCFSQQQCLKNGKKMISTGRKISFPPARISSFFQNYFYLILIIVSTSSKIALTKKILFPRGTRSCFNSWMKDIEKYVATIWKSCFYFKTFLKRLLSNGSSLRIDFPLISIIVSASRKNLRKMKKK